MKNIDKIKAMTTWELAVFLRKVADGQTKFTICENECAKCECSTAYCTSEIGDWLLSDVAD